MLQKYYKETDIKLAFIVRDIKNEVKINSENIEHLENIISNCCELLNLLYVNKDDNKSLIQHWIKFYQSKSKNCIRNKTKDSEEVISKNYKKIYKSINKGVNID